MVSKYNRNPIIESVTISETFDEFEAELYMPHTATGHKEKLKLRPFIFIDGEGVTHKHHTDDDPKSYALIGASTGERLISKDLTTLQIFDFLINLKVNHPDGIFVGFALNYDVNMMCKDLPVELLSARIRKAKRTRWKQYTILYMPNKRFQITDRYKHVTFTVSDIFTFFGCSFVEACNQYIGPDDSRLVEVRQGKALRQEFLWEEMDSLIEPYMSLELDLGVELIGRLRTYLISADIFPRGWHGPGAVAAALIRKHHIKDAMQRPQREVIECSRRAYFGGRFEQMKTGYYNGDIWQYDIRSAYPYALTQCPDLSRGTWTLRPEATDNGSQFKMYALRYKDLDSGPTSWHPLPLRSSRQTIHYQGWVHGIYWGPEAEIVLNAFPDKVEIASVLEFDDDGTRPFEFINDMYAQRALWKSQGNPAQLALKLGMNSLYGKLAQRVGWNEVTRSAPPSHQLEWAGYCTSVCRAMMLELMLQSPDTVVAVETDGLFSSAPLQVNEGKGLGQIDADEWDGIVYIQSGVYFKRSGHRWTTSKTRGFGKNTLAVTDALEHAIGLESMSTHQNRFVGMAYADTERWRKFVPHEHIVQWGGDGKRVHKQQFCQGCARESTWHQTTWVPGVTRGVNSQPHTLPWIDNFTNVYQQHVDNAEVFI